MSETHKTQAVRKLIQKFKQAFPDLEGKVFYTTDADYSEDGIDISKQPKPPVIHIIGPREERNALFTTQEKPTVRKQNDTQFTRYTAEEATDLTFTITVLTDKSLDLLGITERIHAYFLNGKSIEVERQPGTPGPGTVKYELDLVGKFIFGRMVNMSNLKEASGQVIIRGVLISDGEIFEEGYVAEEVNVTAKTV